MRYRLALALACAPVVVLAGGIPGAAPTPLEPVEVRGTRSPAPLTKSASQGYVTAAQLEHRPRLRNGELLEAVPGLIVTQHSGDGKANQYFLRGFNLDHGTDFRTTVAGMPVNFSTHGHGQGYTDLGFVIPELVASVAYKKGTYYAEEGDFSAAGAAHLDYAKALPHALVSATFGADQFQRLFAADSLAVGDGQLLLAGESLRLDGPWLLPENAGKSNLVARYTGPMLGGEFSLMAMGYSNDWRSTDQIARRAVDSGVLDRFGSLDPTTGGETHRRSLSARFERISSEQRLALSAYAGRYDLNLFSNFTYFLDDPVNGDQFEQEDDRHFGGAAIEFERHTELLGRHVHVRLGSDLRRDVIANVGLYRTAQRTRLSTVREDAVRLSHLSAYSSATLHWTNWLRSTLGLRFDGQRASVQGDQALNAGRAADHLTSPKLSVQISPTDRWDLFINAGSGFHSNDARGSTISVDPADGITPLDRVELLVPTRGGEVGSQLRLGESLKLSASVWALNLDSELVFIGDAGNTEANRPSRRRGAELSAYWTPLPQLIVDADIALSRARFADEDPAGDRIPGSIEETASVGLVLNQWQDFSAGLRLRYFGPRPLVEDDSVRSSSSTLLNARGSYRLTPQVSLALDLFNLLDREVSDIDYFYESQLAGEAASAEDIHFHPAEPLTARLSLDLRF